MHYIKQIGFFFNHDFHQTLMSDLCKNDKMIFDIVKVIFCFFHLMVFLSYKHKFTRLIFTHANVMKQFISPIPITNLMIMKLKFLSQ